MNDQTTSLSAGAKGGRLLFALFLLLLVGGRSQIFGMEVSRPYLSVVGPPPLRFQECDLRVLPHVAVSPPHTAARESIMDVLVAPRSSPVVERASKRAAYVSSEPNDSAPDHLPRSSATYRQE